MAGPLVGGAPTTASGITRDVYRRAIQAQVNPFNVYTTDGLATGGEARRWVVCSSLEDGEDGAGRLAGRYLYVATGDHAGFQTRVVSSGYEGAAGYLQVTRPFPGVLASGTQVEISANLPGETYLDVKGANQIVNEALARCVIEYRLSLTGNGTRSQSLIGEDYIDQNERVDALYDTAWTIVGDPLELSPDATRVDTSGATRTLVTDLTYSSDQTYEARVLRRGDTFVKSNGSWGDSTVGLTSDDQAAAVPLGWVVAFGSGKALQTIRRVVRQDARLSRQERADRIVQLNAEIRTWAMAALKIQREHFPQPTAAVMSSLVGFSAETTWT